MNKPQAKITKLPKGNSPRSVRASNGSFVVRLPKGNKTQTIIKGI